jgi:hypothetical protein
MVGLDLAAWSMGLGWRTRAQVSSAHLSFNQFYAPSFQDDTMTPELSVHRELVVG